MRRTSASRQPDVLDFNATPMVDVIFMLTIFFMLVTRFSSAEQIPMDLPRPEPSVARVPKGTDRIIVNCRLADPTEPDSSDVLYSIGPNNPESLSVIGDRLASPGRSNPQFASRHERSKLEAPVSSVSNPATMISPEDEVVILTEARRNLWTSKRSLIGHYARLKVGAP